MPSTTIEKQIRNLEIQLQLQESNYRYAMELRKDFAILRRVRNNIKALKELLQSLKEYSMSGKRNLPGNYIFKESTIDAIRKYGPPYVNKKNFSVRNNRNK